MLDGPKVFEEIGLCSEQRVPQHRLVYTVNGRAVLVGDGVKVSKEARYMPGVKKMVQESEDSSKGEFIFGHMFGALGVLLGDA